MNRVKNLEFICKCGERWIGHSLPDQVITLMMCPKCVEAVAGKLMCRGDYLSVPYPADWQFGNNSFSADGWVHLCVDRGAQLTMNFTPPTVNYPTEADVVNANANRYEIGALWNHEQRTWVTTHDGPTVVSRVDDDT